MNSEQARYVGWSLILGVGAPFSAYLVVAFIATGADDLTSPIDRGQFYLASVGVLAGVLQRLATPRDLVDERGANAAEIVKPTLIVAIVIAIGAWTTITVGSLTEADWVSSANVAAWIGAVFLGACGAFGYKSLELLD